MSILRTHLPTGLYLKLRNRYSSW